MKFPKGFIKNTILLVILYIPICFFVIVNIEKRSNKALYTKLESEVALIASTLNPSEISALTGSLEDLSTANYQTIKRQFINIGKSLKSTNVRWIYAMRKTPNGIIFLLDSADPSDIGYSPPGTIYKNPPQSLIEKFDSALTFTTKPYEDEYGEYISAYAPITSDEKSVVAILAADIDYAPIMKNIQTERILMSIMGLGILIFLISILYFISKIFETKRIVDAQKQEIEISKSQTMNVISQLEKEKQISQEQNIELQKAKRDLEIQIADRTRELQTLNQSLETEIAKQTSSLQEKIKELNSYNKMMTGRELKMVELKNKIAELENKLNSL